MSEFTGMYKITISNLRNESRQELRNLEKSYSTLSDKESDYALVLKSILELKRSVAEIYENAEDDIFSDRKPF